MYHACCVPVRFDLDALDEAQPFEVDRQAAHLFKHPRLGLDDVMDAWNADPLFYPAKPPAHWLMLAEVGGRVLVVPLAPSRSAIRAHADPTAATKRPWTWPAPIEGIEMSTENTPPTMTPRRSTRSTPTRATRTLRDAQRVAGDR